MSQDLEPKRVTLSRKKGWRIPPNTVKVDRSTQWGNPYRIGEKHLHPEKHVTILIQDKQSAVAAFRGLMRSQAGKELVKLAKRELRGKNLACWCKGGDLCHADILLTISNQ